MVLRNVFLASSQNCYFISSNLDFFRGNDTENFDMNAIQFYTAIVAYGVHGKLSSTQMRFESGLKKRIENVKAVMNENRSNKNCCFCMAN